MDTSNQTAMDVSTTIKHVHVPAEITGSAKNLNSEKQIQCKFYMARKKRCCRAGVLKNHDYCAEHTVNHISEEKGYKRVPCPFDPAHSCYEKLLKKHLKKCNMRPKVPEVYFSHGINSDDTDNTTCSGDQSSDRLADMSVEELSILINLVRSVHKEFVPSVPSMFGIHPALGSEMLRTDVGNSVMKHLVQNASLLSIMEEHKLFQTSTCFLEFGSGKGALTFWLASTANKEKCSFVLLDRQSHRHKKDNKLKDSGMDIQRIRIDIEHLKLDKLPAVVNAEHIVGVTKHLCGSATDMTLKCLLGTNGEVSKVSGLVLATCCHHRCTWSGYVAKKQLEEWGLSKKYFNGLIGMAGWGVCGTGRTKFKDDEVEKTEIVANPRYAALNLTVDERRNLGLQVKEILDYGRALYVRSFGLNSALNHYVDNATTLENIAIVASRP